MSKKSKRYVNRNPEAIANPGARFEFNPDYSAVRKDLRRIGMLAGFFILVLIGLSFFLR